MLTILTLEFLIAYILWFILKKLPKANKGVILVVCLAVSLAAGYKGSYNIMAHNITLNSLEIINAEHIQEFNRGITIEEEKKLKEEIAQSGVISEAFSSKIMTNFVLPSLIVIFAMLYIAEWETRKEKEEKAK